MMPIDRARDFIESIFAADDTPLDCSSLMDVIARYVELEALGEDPTRFAGGVPQHCDACPVCAELYGALLAVARLEAAGDLPEAGALWAELRDATRAGHDGAERREPAIRAFVPPPARPGPTFAPPPAHPLPVSPPSAPTSLGWPLKALLALAAATLVAFGGGWWRAQAELAEAEQLMHALGRTNSTRFVKTADGAWAKLFYDGEDRQAIVYVGHLPAIGQAETLTCWLKRRGADPHMAGTYDSLSGGSEWWTIEGEGNLSTYSALALTVEPGGRPVLELPLAEPPDDR